MIVRRSVILLLAVMESVTFAAELTPSPSAAMLSRDIAIFDRQGVKQTGSPGNLATINWVTKRLKRQGYAVTDPPFDQPTYRVERTAITFDNRTVEAFPLFPPQFTGGSGIIGSLVTWDGKIVPTDAAGKIALLLLPDQRHSSVKLSFKRVDLAAATRAGFAGIVAVTRGPTGDLIALNADGESTLPQIPILLAAGRDGAVLQDAAAHGSRAKLVIKGWRLPQGRARNVVARLVRGPRWIVISTPLSGWFHATAERGPGVTIFLAMAERIAKANPCDSIALVATSGHESGYGGMAAAIDAGLVPKPEETRLWVHLGAGLAAYDARGADAEPARYMLATAAAIDATRAAFAGVAGYDKPYAVDSHSALGETEVVIARGYSRVVGGLSAHLYHHSRNDRANRTSGALILPVAQGFDRLIFSAMDQTSCR